MKKTGLYIMGWSEYFWKILMSQNLHLHNFFKSYGFESFDLLKIVYGSNCQIQALSFQRNVKWHIRQGEYFKKCLSNIQTSIDFNLTPQMTSNYSTN